MLTGESPLSCLFLTQLLTAEMSNDSWARLSLFRFMLTLMRRINLLQACDWGSSSQLISAPRSWRLSFQRLGNNKKHIIHLTLNEISTSQITIWPNTAECIRTCFRFTALQLFYAHCAHDRVSLLICNLYFPAALFMLSLRVHHSSIHFYICDQCSKNRSWEASFVQFGA